MLGFRFRFNQGRRQLKRAQACAFASAVGRGHADLRRRDRRLRQNLCARHIGIEEIQRRIQAQHHQTRNGPRSRMPISVAELAVRAPAQDSNVGTAGAIEQHNQRQKDRQYQAGHDVRQCHSGERRAAPALRRKNRTGGN
jgi:hypothetical protein